MEIRGKGNAAHDAVIVSGKEAEESMKKQISQREAERRLAELIRKDFKGEVQLLLKEESVETQTGKASHRQLDEGEAAS